MAHDVGHTGVVGRRAGGVGAPGDGSFVGGHCTGELFPAGSRAVQVRFDLGVTGSVENIEVAMARSQKLRQQHNQRRDATCKLETLTAREREVLDRLAIGSMNKPYDVAFF